MTTIGAYNGGYVNPALTASRTPTIAWTSPAAW